MEIKATEHAADSEKVILYLCANGNLCGNNPFFTSLQFPAVLARSA